MTRSVRGFFRLQDASALRRSRALEGSIANESAKMTGASAVEETTWDDQGAIVCEELSRLPDRYRAAVVLCDLEGLTQERASQINWRS